MLTLDYLSFTTADLERTLAFYRTLGLPMPPGAHLDADGEPQGHVEVALGGLRVAWESEALARRVNPAWTPPGGTRMGVALRAASPGEVDETCARMTAAGFTVRDAPTLSI